MPQPATPCPRCDATWTGLAVCHCGACHRTFSGLTLFDAHRRGGKCADPAGVDLRVVDGIWRYPERDRETLPTS